MKVHTKIGKILIEGVNVKVGRLLRMDGYLQALRGREAHAAS